MSLSRAAAAQATLDAQTVATSCIRAIEAIETVQAGALNATPSASLPTNAEVSSTGNLILHDFIASWEKATGRTMVEGRFFTATGGVGLFSPFKGAYDGKIFQTYSSAVNMGQLIEAGANLVKYRHIPLLLGHGIIEHPTRDVSQILRQSSAQLVDPESADALPILEATYLQHAGTDNETEMTLRVTVDLNHGALPSRIQCLKSQKTLHTEVIITRFHQTEDGVWVPLVGTLQLFDLSIHTPAGYTFDDVARMSLEERSKIGAHYIPAPIGPPEEIVVSEHNLRINRPLTSEDLTFRFPEGAVVYDEFNDIRLVAGSGGTLVPQKPSTQPQKEEEIQTRRSIVSVWLVLVNLVLAAGIAAVVWRRKRQS